MRNIFILLLLVFNIISAQSSKKDSLIRNLTQLSDNDELIKTHLKIYNLTKDNDETAYQHLIKANQLINNDTSDSIVLNINIARATHNLFSGNYDSVFFYIDKKKIIDSVKFSKELIVVFINKGLAEYYKSEYNKAIANYIKAAKIIERNKNNYKIARVYNNIGIAYIKLENWEKAKEYMLKSLSISKKFKLKRGISYTLGNLGIIYKNQNKYDTAITMYQESLSFSKELNDERAILRTNSSIGGLYKEKGNYKTAIIYFKKSLQKAEKLKDKQSISINLLNMGSLYYNQQNYKTAEKFLKKSLKISKEIGVLDHIMDAYKQLAMVFEKQGNLSSAILSYKNYEKVKDSIFNKEKLKSLNSLEAKFQSEKKTKELTEQKLILKKRDSELQKKRYQFTLMTSLVIFLFAGSILTWFLYQQRQKNKNQEILTLKREQQVKTLESLMEGEENERLRIAKELHDGINVDLSAIKYKLSSLLEKNNKTINEAVDMIDKSCEQVRTISHNLIPPSLKDFSLIEAIEDYCSTMNNLHKPTIMFQHIGNSIILSKKAEVNIFRIIQELVNNSVKHSGASEIDVQISFRENTLQLTIEDNGKGFKKEKVEGKGIGLQSFKTRIEYLKAKLDFNSSSEGTSYIIDINTKELP